MQTREPSTYRIGGQLTKTAIVLSEPRVPIGDEVFIVVRSVDAKNISVLDVKAYIPPISKVNK
jgi:hypothetical protein